MSAYRARADTKPSMSSAGGSLRPARARGLATRLGARCVTMGLLPQIAVVEAGAV